MDNSPSAIFRPIPMFFGEPLSFSTKKEREMTPRDRVPPPPKPSARKVVSLSRTQNKNPARALPVTFRALESTIATPIYNECKRESYLSQCFEVINKLGVGSFGEVYKVKSKDDGKLYAIKKSRQKYRSDDDRMNKMGEVEKFEKLPVHKNCVRYVKAWEEKNTLYIQMELCKMSLSKYADKNHNIEEKFIWNCLVDLLMALQNLHNHNLIHMDIKPENIFISGSNVCKLGDFGLVLDLNKKNLDPQDGDSKYLAPELLKGVYGKAADIFSLGITILELACDLLLPTGETLWQRLRSEQLPEELLQKRSDELKEMIKWMMCPDHNLRPTVDDLLKHEYVAKIREERILVEDIEEDESPSEQQQTQTVEVPVVKTARGLLSAFENVANVDKKAGSPALTPRHTPVNQVSPLWNSRASSVSPFEDLEKEFDKPRLKTLKFSPSPSDDDSTNPQSKNKDDSWGNDEGVISFRGSPERKRLYF